MTLNPTTSYPNSRTYVLKLHRDAGASLSQLSGRLEHLATGRHFEFPTAAALLAHLLSELVADKTDRDDTSLVQPSA
jgi:hypothetical protein